MVLERKYRYSVCMCIFLCLFLCASVCFDDLLFFFYLSLCVCFFFLLGSINCFYSAFFAFFFVLCLNVENKTHNMLHAITYTGERRTRPVEVQKGKIIIERHVEALQLRANSAFGKGRNSAIPKKRKKKKEGAKLLTWVMIYKHTAGFFVILRVN